MDLRKYRAKLVGSEEERAVSPVIGVVLMVAVTVILAAIIAAFVMDMGDDLTTEANAGVVIDSEEDMVSATWQSEGNSDYVDVSFEIVDYDIDGGDIEGDDLWLDGELEDGSVTLDSPGDRESAYVKVDTEEEDLDDVNDVTVEVVAVASSDGTSTVVQDTEKTVIPDTIGDEEE